MKLATVLAVGVLPLALLACLSIAGPAAAQPVPPGSGHHFGIQPGSFEVTPSSTQAGAHGDVTIAFDFAHGAGGRTFNDPRTTVVELPAGFAGSTTAVRTCTQAQLLAEGIRAACPADSQVGTISLSFTLESSSARVSFPLYDMALTGPGIPAELGFRALIVSQLMPLAVRPQDGGLTVTTPNLTTIGEPRDISVTIWGVPAAASHDAERGRECLPVSLTSAEVSCSGGGETVDSQPRPFLANPDTCGEPLTATLEADSWEEPESWARANAEAGPFFGCDRLPFDPTIEALPTSDATESPTGFDLSLAVPQFWEDPLTPAASSLKSARIALPEGFSLNPSLASGLGACTPAQLERETARSRAGEGCPDNSKIGKVEIETPILAEKASGALYIAKPFDNPTGSRFAIYIVARAPAAGVLVKLASRLEPDPRNGRLTAVIEEAPQLPFSRLTLRFWQGETAPFASPPACGGYAVQADLTPWSGPLEPRHASDSFAIERGPRGGPCPPAEPPPFQPKLIAGSLNNAAGAYTPFYARLSRQDGEGEIANFSIELPPGLSGRLAGIAPCSEPAIEAATGKTGAEEEASPSCPPASQVGRTLLGAGVGSVLAWAPGRIYLAGPYAGAPLSLAIVTPVTIGPFDLGTVVLREALRIDPETAQLSVDSSGSAPLPQIVDGVPLHLRDLRIYLDRPEFTLNPTSCEPMSVASALTGSAPGFDGEGGYTPLRVLDPFQIADCQSLGFAPKLRLRLLGADARNGHPGLRAVLLPRAGDANIARAAFTLPRTELLDPSHIRAVCTSAEFAAESCPKSSIYGHAAAWSPLLRGPLRGPVYLRSSSHQLPDLVASLNGQVQINLDGRIDTADGAIGIGFEAIPDIPVTKLVLSIKGGRNGLLVNSTSLCARAAHAAVKLVGQNGKSHNMSPVLATKDCASK
ncbi:MAG TPA: hypothetical protein VNY83_08690 [Solirubrobacterales bacterium]|nr:hypothetical protein [Solirubrobacterales bacterium]